MEIIPVSMFSILNDVIAVQTKQLHELPVRLEKETLRDFAQPDERYKLAKATNRAAVFTQGIMAMKKTFMGAIEVDPWQLLEIGIRKLLEIGVWIEFWELNCLCWYRSCVKIIC